MDIQKTAGLTEDFSRRADEITKRVALDYHEHFQDMGVRSVIWLRPFLEAQMPLSEGPPTSLIFLALEVPFGDGYRFIGLDSNGNTHVNFLIDPEEVAYRFETGVARETPNALKPSETQPSSIGPR